MHFKTNANSVIQTAMTGDQSNLNAKEFANSYYELKPPAKYKNYKIPIRMIQRDSIDYVGSSTKGGFSVTAFGAKIYNAYWTVVGDNPKTEIFECGSRHSPNDEDLNKDSPSSIATHHSIWFRGHPPSKQVIAQRLIEKLGKIPGNK